MPLALEKLNPVFKPTLANYDGINIPADWNNFDLIYSCFVTQHMAKKSLKQLLVSASNALAPTGRIVFEFFGSPNYMDEGFDCFSENNLKGAMYNNGFSRREIERLAAAVNLLVEIEDWPVSDEGISFNNFWATFKKNRASFHYGN